MVATDLRAAIPLPQKGPLGDRPLPLKLSRNIHLRLLAHTEYGIDVIINLIRLQVLGFFPKS
jgi:hypothetical protein